MHTNGKGNASLSPFFRAGGGVLRPRIANRRTEFIPFDVASERNEFRSMSLPNGIHSVRGRFRTE
jgi:hypothetical protein